MNDKDLQKRLEKLVADSPLNDEPLTPEQEEFFHRMYAERPPFMTERQLKALRARLRRPSRVRSKPASPDPTRSS